MAKLMYSEVGGFHNFPDSETPSGWVDGEPIRQAILSAKRMTGTIPETLEAGLELVVSVNEVTPLPEELQIAFFSVVPQPPQDTPKRRPGRPPKNLVMENDLEHSTDDN